MDAGAKSSSSPLASFKSKKQPRSPAPSDQKSRKTPNSESDPNPWSVKTPGKAVDPPRRSRQRGVAMSIKEVREAAMKLRERRSDPVSRNDDPFADELVETPQKKKNNNKKAVGGGDAAEIITLPDNYELLDKFFNSLDTSIRLLQLKRLATTFTSISSQIAILTDRRFTHSHLAQLKFIVPEAIVIEKILQLDECTSCMRPDLRITLNVDAVEGISKSKSFSGYLQLRKVFRGRLLDFFKSHPEGEVPEESLPKPFNRPKGDASANSVRPASSLMSEIPPDAILGRQAAALHLSPSFRPSFRKRFSQLGSSHYTENTVQENSVTSVHAPVDSEVNLPKSPIPKKNIASASKTPLGPLDEEICYMATAFAETPAKFVNSIKGEEQCSTPVQLAFTPAKLMSATPMINPPERCYMSPDDNSSRSPSKLSRRQPANRPLKFDTPVKNVKVDDDIVDILPEALLESIREKERKASLEQDPAISQAKRRSKMIACLPKLFDMMYFIFQSLGRSVVTKKEMRHKIIAGNLDIVDCREIDEQLELLQELAPELIYEKLILSGDLLCFNKISSPEAIRIRTRLAEAK